MATPVQDREVAAETGFRRMARAGGGHAVSAHQGLGFAIAGASILLLVLPLDGLLIAASAGVQYALVRRR